MRKITNTLIAGAVALALTCGYVTPVARAVADEDAGTEEQTVFVDTEVAPDESATVLEDAGQDDEDLAVPSDEPSVTGDETGEAAAPLDDESAESREEVVEPSDSPSATDTEAETAEDTGNQAAQGDESAEGLWKGREAEIKNKVIGEGIQEVEGVPLSVQTTGSRSSYSYAKINGKYVNLYGDQIAGAVSRGIDVSEFQGRPDWARVKTDDVHYVIIRCGYAGNTTRYDDEEFLYNAKECERLGIPYGVYLYSYATNTAEAKDEAQHVLRLLKGRKLSLPVFYDLEDPCQTDLSRNEFAGIAKTFCNAIEAAGYDAGVYASVSWWEYYLTDSCFGNWEKWVAQYYKICEYEGSYDYWQATGGYEPYTIYVDGIDGYVDTNYDFGASGTSGLRKNLKNSSKTPSISYCGYIQGNSWQSTKYNGATMGTSGQALRIEAMQIALGGVSGGVQYRTHVQNLGWLSWVSNGAVSGTEHADLRIEAVEIKLTGDAAKTCDIWYRAHVQNIGWQSWAKNGETAGTSGKGLRVEALEIRVTPKGSFVDVGYSTPHYDDILWMRSSGITTGFQDGTFRPYSNIARADMAAFLYRLAGSPSYTPTAQDKAKFSDVKASTPHAKEIWWLASTGISTGYPNGTFQPYTSVTRCDMAAFLYRLAGSPSYTPTSQDKAKFTDVNSSTPHAKEIWWLASTGVSTGYPNGTFRPDASVARCDMAAFLHRMKTKGLV